jgi:hypothetical protein
LLLAIVSGLYWYQGTQFELTKSRFDAFVAETKAVGVVADLQGRLKNQKYEQHKKDSDHEINLARGSLLAYADKLRNNQKRPGRSILPTPAPSPGNPKETSYDIAQLVGAMERYSEEERGFERETTELLTEGSISAIELDGVKTWAQGLTP